MGIFESRLRTFSKHFVLPLLLLLSSSAAANTGSTTPTTTTTISTTTTAKPITKPALVTEAAPHIIQVNNETYLQKILPATPELKLNLTKQTQTPAKVQIQPPALASAQTSNYNLIIGPDQTMHLIVGDDIPANILASTFNWHTQRNSSSLGVVDTGKLPRMSTRQEVVHVQPLLTTSNSKPTVVAPLAFTAQKHGDFLVPVQQQQHKKRPTELQQQQQQQRPLQYHNRQYWPQQQQQQQQQLLQYKNNQQQSYTPQTEQIRNNEMNSQPTQHLMSLNNNQQQTATATAAAVGAAPIAAQTNHAAPCGCAQTARRAVPTASINNRVPILLPENGYQQQWQQQWSSNHVGTHKQAHKNPKIRTLKAKLKPTISKPNNLRLANNSPPAEYHYRLAKKSHVDDSVYDSYDEDADEDEDNDYGNNHDELEYHDEMKARYQFPFPEQI